MFSGVPLNFSEHLVYKTTVNSHFFEYIKSPQNRLLIQVLAIVGTAYKKYSYSEIFWSIFSRNGLNKGKYFAFPVFSANAGNYRPE